MPVSWTAFDRVFGGCSRTSIDDVGWVGKLSLGSRTRSVAKEKTPSLSLSLSLSKVVVIVSSFESNF